MFYQLDDRRESWNQQQFSLPGVTAIPIPQELLIHRSGAFDEVTWKKPNRAPQKP